MLAWARVGINWRTKLFGESEAPISAMIKMNIVFFLCVNSLLQLQSRLQQAVVLS